MNSKLTRFIINLLVITLVFSLMTGTASAAAERSSTCISSYAGGLTKSGSSVTVSFNITARSTMSTLGASMIVIEKWTTQGWTPAKTFYSSTTENMTSLDTAYHGGSVTYTGASSGQYRAKISFYAASSSESDSKSLTTNKITIS